MRESYCLRMMISNVFLENTPEYAKLNFRNLWQWHILTDRFRQYATGTVCRWSCIPWTES